jgi:large subunit ribosomal protein L19
MPSRIRQAETPYLRTIQTDFRVGDTVDVATRIVEGEKERIQTFTGRVIRRRGGGLSETFTVRRIVMGEGVERIFPLHSPKIAGVKVASRGEVRRSKLYYMRNRVGKATRLREILKFEEGGLAAVAPAPAAAKAPGDAQAGDAKPAGEKPAPRAEKAKAPEQAAAKK